MSTIIYSLGVNGDGLLEVRRAGKTLGAASNKEELKRLLVDFQEGRDICMCSSSIDFPHEYTKRRKVIDLCNLLRS